MSKSFQSKKMNRNELIQTADRLRIAIIAPSRLPVPATKGGAIETLINGLIDKNEERWNMEITVFTPFDKDAKIKSGSYHHTNFVWIKYNLGNKFVNLFNRCYSKIARVKIPHYGIIQILNGLKKGNYDRVLIEGDDQLIIPVNQHITKEKIVFHLHARLFSQPEIYNHCNKVLTVSNYIRQQVLLNTWIAEQSVVVIKNCTNIERFRRESNSQYRDPMRNTFGISCNEVVISFTGRIVKEKGIKELLEALLLLPISLPYKLLIVGSSGSSFGLSRGKTTYYKELQVLAQKLEGRVIFTGFINNEDIPKILAASDIAAIPSIYEEPGALTIFESLAASLPIVTTNSGGIPEYVTEECAFIIRRDSNLISGLSEALRILITSKDKREQFGKHGFQHVQQYSYDRFYNDIFKELAN